MKGTWNMRFGLRMFIIGRTRRGFPPEYKDDAVRLVIHTGRTVARALGLNE
jgi:transposase-like protein